MKRFTFDRQLAARRAMFALLLVLAALLQHTRGVLPAIGRADCFLLLPLCVAIAMHEGSVVAMLFGAFGGALWDFAAPSGDGFYAAALCLLCFLCGALCSFLLRVNLRSFLLLCALGGALLALAHWFFFLRLTGIDPVGALLTGRELPSLLYTLAVSPVCYGAVKAVCRKRKHTLTVDR